MRRRRRLVLLAIAVALAVAVPLLSQDCASGGAMASRYRTCTCRGVEWLITDRTAADGPRRTICLGLVTSRSCFQFRDGPQIPC